MADPERFERSACTLGGYRPIQLGHGSKMKIKKN